MMRRRLRAFLRRSDRRWAAAAERVARSVSARLTRDPQLRAMAPDRKVSRRASAASSADRRIDAILEGYSTRPAIGERAYTVDRDPATGHTYRRHEPWFRTTSYGEVRERVRAVAAAWHHVAALRVEPGDRVAIIGFAGSDFAVLDFACLYAKAVSVPLQSTTSASDMDSILERTEPRALAASIGALGAVAERAIHHPSVRSLIAFDYDPAVDGERDSFEAAREILERAGSRIRLVSLDDVVTIGRAEPFAFLPPDPGGAERLAVIIHSSGSTGTPKGAMLREATVLQNWNTSRDTAGHLTLLVVPLSHSMGRSLFARQMRKGSLTYMTLKPDMTTLLEDVRLTRPTSLTIFPRVLDLIVKHFDGEVTRRARDGASEAEARAATMKEMRAGFLGDRLRMIIVGSAPTSEHVKRFLAECFRVKVVDVYSSTETGLGALSVDGRMDRNVVLDFRLRDVPELGYHATDTPYPRGELCFKTKHQIGGYYGDLAASAELLTDDGFIASGDIVELRGDDELVIVDRRQDVVKLSQGEYVAVGRLAAEFQAGSPLIRHIHLHGNPHRSYLVAVVVPDPEVLATALGSGADDDRVKDLVHAELRRVGESAGLKPFEIPRDFIIEHEPFTPENGLLTSLHKPRRSALRDRYGDRLEAMYADAAGVTARSSRRRDRELTTRERVAEIVAGQLGLARVEPNPGLTYTDLGGDSLGAVELSMEIEKAFGVALPGDRILGPTGTVERIAGEIDALLADDDQSVTLERVHGRGATTLHRAQLTLDAFLDAATLSAARDLPPANDPPRAVLVTGATGFLGREVCLQWMERLAPAGGRVVCLVRAPDDVAARARLTEAFAASDAYLARFAALAGDHLDVVAGDIGRIRFGLDDATFGRLATGIDRIAHVAALVNHRLEYQHLFNPNVAGTAEVIRLAASERRKPIDFVSTVAVLPLLDSSTGDDEAALPRSSVPAATSRYAHGYAASKWAAEILLRDAAALGIPVNILRGPMMLPHRNTPRVINTDDVFSRLLYSIIVTGLAPRSFYRRPVLRAAAPPSYNALPVEIVAAAVVAAADSRNDGCMAVDLVAPARDGGSLDDIVDWVESAGYPLERSADHAEWIGRFRSSLDALPAAQKSASALEVLAPYARPLPRKTGGAAGSARFRQLLGSTRYESLPAIDEAYVHKCIADLRGLGLIPPPR